jgi:hypothetical protein
VVDGEPFGVFDRQTLTVRVAGPGRPLVEVRIDRFADPGLDD